VGARSEGGRRAMTHHVGPSPEQGLTAAGAARRAPDEMRLPSLSIGLSQHPDQHRPERAVLLQVDQELCEGAAPGFLNLGGR
jgi:hypothetical protein